MDFKRYKPVGILAVFIIVIPLLTSLLGVNFYLTQLTMSVYYLLVALGLCMLMGYAGQISLGQAAFFAIGGYTTAFLTTFNLLNTGNLRVLEMLSGIGIPVAGHVSWWDQLSLSLVQFLTQAGCLVNTYNSYGNKILTIYPWIAFIAAVLLSAGIAFLIGIPVLKLKGHYLAMATLGFVIIIEKIVRGTKLLGGADGITNVPAFSLLPGIKVSGEMQDRVMNYFIAWLIIIIGLIMLINLINSRAGRALRALHGSEEAADSMGINTARYKLYVFVIGAVFASIAGIFMTHYNGSIGPGEANIMKSIRYVAIVAVGGMANIWGTLIMGLILNFLSLRGVFGTYDDAVFGAILIFVMIFSPEGFIRRDVLKGILQFFNKIKSKNDASGN